MIIRHERLFWKTRLPLQDINMVSYTVGDRCSPMTLELYTDEVDSFTLNLNN